MVFVNKISGHTSINLGQGTDTLNIDQVTKTLAANYGLLTVSGDIPQAVVTNLVNGSPRQGTAVDPVNSMQRIDVQATGGTYFLTVSSGTFSALTGAIAWNASAAVVAAAINAALGVHGHVTVRKAGASYYVSFDGSTAADADSADRLARSRAHERQRPGRHGQRLRQQRLGGGLGAADLVLAERARTHRSRTRSRRSSSTPPTGRSRSRTTAAPP